MRSSAMRLSLVHCVLDRAIGETHMSSQSTRFSQKNTQVLKHSSALCALSSRPSHLMGVRLNKICLDQWDSGYRESAFITDG